MTVKKLTCVVCPFGCTLEVKLGDSGEFVGVTGHTCKRGAAYAESEMTNPVRTLTSTVKITGADGSMLPVKTSAPIPKDRLFEAMDRIKKISATAPIACGDVLEKDFLMPGVNLVACKSMEATRG